MHTEPARARATKRHVWGIGLAAALVTVGACKGSNQPSQSPVTIDKSTLERGTVSDASAVAPMVAEFGDAYAAEGPAGTDGERSYSLVAAPTEVALPLGNSLKVWSYNGKIPGPVLRVRLGETINIHLDNKLPQPTTIHFHGVRVPNAMDGVPGVTQPPIPPGGSFDYRFAPKDAGTFWFHPHVRGSEQVERGLAGVLVVEDAKPYGFSRDLVWVLDDWRLTLDGESNQIDPRFNSRHDLAHDGRWGNVITVNGKTETVLKVTPGERIRLRLVNVANGRVFAPDFGDLEVRAIAIDGMYTAGPVQPNGFELAPGNRMDVDLTIGAEDGGRTFQVTNRFGRRPSTLATIVVQKVPAVATPDFPTPASAHLPLWKEGIAAPVDLEYVLNAKRGGKFGISWTIDGEIYGEHKPKSLPAQRWAKIRFRNDSGRLHPMHLHGQFFKVLSRNGQAVDEPFWRDTVLVHRKETVDVGMVPLDVGTWAMHCHILEHAESGMMTVLMIRPADEKMPAMDAPPTPAPTP